MARKPRLPAETQPDVTPPPPPPTGFPSSSPEPPGWVGQPQAMPKTLLGAALEAALNPNPAGQPMTFVNNDGHPVTFVNDKPIPRDEFAKAAAEAVLNPDPGVEQEIFDYGKKETEPSTDGASTAGVGGQS